MSLFQIVLATVLAFGIIPNTFATTPTKVDATPLVQTTSKNSVAKSPQNPTKANINTASVKDLQALKGMNASKARAIVAYRKKQGEFKNLDDLKNVSGFKKMTDEVRQGVIDQLTLG